MSDTPWQRAQEEQARQEGFRQEAEKAQQNLSSGGLGGAIGMFAAIGAASVLGPSL